MKKNPPITEAQMAQFRFSVIALLLTLPKGSSQRSALIKELSEREHLHPRGELVKVSESTIWRWVKLAQRSSEPLRSLQSEPRPKRGNKAVSDVFAKEIRKLREAHPVMDTQLLYDNLLVSVDGVKRPSYSTVLRFCKSQALLPQNGPKANRRILPYEHRYVNSLWHLDFHHGKEEMRIVDKDGKYRKVYIIAIFDDCSRFALHAQWYFSEGTECLIHALKQAFLKYALPTSIYQDNGSSMVCQEYKEGLKRLGVDGRHTRVYSPYMNGKVERPWGRIEKRFLGQLKTEGLSLEALNMATQAWLYEEYNVTFHQGVQGIPREQFLKGPHAGLPAPTSDAVLDRAFTIEKQVTLKAVVLTIRVNNIDYQLPAHYAGIKTLTVAYRRWDYSYVYLVNERTGDRELKVYPVDKIANASGERGKVFPEEQASSAINGERMTPLLARQVAHYQEKHVIPTHINSPQIVKTIAQPFIPDNATSREDLK